MAYVRADGHEVPLVLPLGEEGLALVSSHLLHVRFGFVQSTIYVEEEVMSDSGQLKESVHMLHLVVEDGHVWHLRPGRYRAYGLSPHVMGASNDFLPRQSDYSTVDMPMVHHADSKSAERVHTVITNTPVQLVRVKQELGDLVIDLSSESEGESPSQPSLHAKVPHQFPNDVVRPTSASYSTPSNSPNVSSHSRPPLCPSSSSRISIVSCLQKLATIRGSRNEVAAIDYESMKQLKVQYLPPNFDGNVLFELPSLCATPSTSAAKSLQGMDKRYDGHAWCRTMTSNIQNQDGLKFRKSSCVGHLVCTNPDCGYFKRSTKRNETEWCGYTSVPFYVGLAPPKDSTVLCKICKVPPQCISTCDARIYYIFSNTTVMTRACLHLGNHMHPVASGTCRESLDTISGLIADEVLKTPTATNSAIALAASKQFLDSHLIHNGEGPKELLQGKSLEDVMDRFHILSSPNIRNTISSFRSTGKGGVIDSIMNMKRNLRFEYIHDSVFPGQGKEKVYLFKMLVEGPGSGVDLVRRMQHGGDLENAWLMFDHVKRVKDWTTMACHVYDTECRRVMTIAVCDMQSEDTEVQCIMWRLLNDVMRRNGMEKPNFRGFMADSAQANWNAVRIVYGTGDSKVQMVNRERTCLLHWSTSLHRHTQKLIKPNMQHQHIRLCKQYKDSTTMEEAETRYIAIRSWWLSSGAASEDAMRELELWLAFWHFRYRQWGGFMQMGLNVEEMADMPSCNLSETVHNKWLQQSGNRGNDLFAATCDDCIRAFMQMTNYRAFLKGYTPRSGPSREELKLRGARRSGDAKKIAEALNALPEAVDVGTRIPHLEGEEVFGNNKRKLDLPIGSDGDSHRPDKVNFSQPRVLVRSTLTPTEAFTDVHTLSNSEVPHVTTAMESDCDTLQWHIARLSHKSSCKCHAQQRGTNIRCVAKISNGGKGTPAPTYRGRKKQYGGNKEIVTDFWFCPDDIQRCVGGSKRSWVIDWPQVPEVWPVLTGTSLTRQETLLLQEAGFQLQEQPPMSPRRLFTMSNVFEAVSFDHPSPVHADTYPTTRRNKPIRRIANAPTTEHRNKWESAGNMKGSIVGVTMLPFPGLGAVISLQSGIEPMQKVYRITLGMYPECTCPNFVDMAVSAIGGRHQYVNCKHLYYLFRYFCKMNLVDDKFIHSPGFSFNEVKHLLVKAGIIVVPN